MFGYITPYKSEMKVKDYNVFRAYYCGLCKTLGKEHNQLVRMGLNYDLVFLGILLSSLDEQKNDIKIEKCMTHPLRKKMIIESDESIKYTSDISIILTYFKLIDDWKDDKSIKSLVASVPYGLSVKKLKIKYTKLYDDIDRELRDLSNLEKEKCNVVDKVADTFAKIMEEISSPDYIRHEETKRVLKFIGYNLGRWIYILDAVDDIEEDIKSNSYNPVLLQYEYKENEDLHDFYNRIKESIELSMTISLQNISNGFELLDIKHNKEILENILYMGMRYKMESIINSMGGNKNEKSI